MSLELRDVYKTFIDNGPETPALAGVSFLVPTGDFAVLIGPSGSGKSTICNLITGLIRPDAGHVLVDGVVIDGVPGQVGYMPQRDLLLPWRTVLDNVVLGPEIAGRSRSKAVAQAREMLPLFGLERFADAYPAALSGGMRQRAALLRTFLLERPTLVLDEPFGALDALTRRELQDWLLGVWQHFRPTILFVTHDVREAVLLADRVILLTTRPGRVHVQQAVSLPRPRDDSADAFTRTQTDLLRTLESLPRRV